MDELQTKKYDDEGRLVYPGYTYLQTREVDQQARAEARRQEAAAKRMQMEVREREAQEDGTEQGKGQQ